MSIFPKMYVKIFSKTRTERFLQSLRLVVVVVMVDKWALLLWNVSITAIVNIIIVVEQCYLQTTIIDNNNIILQQTRATDQRQQKRATNSN